MRALPPLAATLLLRLILSTLVALPLALPARAQHSVARAWNEVLLEGIRNDFARPTVHARNLFHVSAAMYDAWAVYDAGADTYLLGKTLHGFDCPLAGIPAPADTEAARRETLAFAAFRLIRHRFRNAPDAEATFILADSLLRAQGFSPVIVDTDYTSGSPAALGNYLARCYIDYGLQDGSNEANAYANLDYEPVNPPLVLDQSGPTGLVDPNRWQPLTLEVFIDQSGNVIPRSTPDFLGPEWGNVQPFALDPASRTAYDRAGFPYPVYHDPGAPPLIGGEAGAEYQWGFAMVAAWSAQLDPHDGVMWDISPASIGNVPALPEAIASYRDFYDLIEGGDTSAGHAVNPYTGQPYAPQVVPRGDYARVLAEFWADGPDSETPPGHWFTILNYVNDHPALVKRFRGEGEPLDDLEWDVKAYFALGGAMHDAAVTAWGIKGWYDYIRPISAIRSMAERGQSSDVTRPRYDPLGIPLIDGLIELVEPGDSLAGENGENVDAIKLYAWRGHEAIADPGIDQAGVGWILARDWWPYQRPSFVTPPFAGYISGHSTFSRAAAEVLTLFTGDAFFPGGLGEFHAPRNAFLVFEEGPSVDVTLQWATYRDASDQTSLSRIWGGIHPPADDIPGRRIGIVIGTDAFRAAEAYFSGATRTAVTASTPGVPHVSPSLYPNPAPREGQLRIESGEARGSGLRIRLFNALGQEVRRTTEASSSLTLELTGLPAGVYFVEIASKTRRTVRPLVVQ